MGYAVHVRAKCAGVTPCKNPLYSQAKFYLPEVFKGVAIPPDHMTSPNCTIVLKAQELQRFGNLSPEQFYDLQLDASVEQPRHDEATGRSYGARTRFSLLQARLVEGK